MGFVFTLFIMKPIILADPYITPATIETNINLMFKSLANFLAVLDLWAE